jgi:integrase
MDTKPQPSEVVEQLLAELHAPTAGAIATIRNAPSRVRVPGFGVLIRRGRIWWIRCSHRGHRREESSKSAEQRTALRLLRKRVEECGKGRRLDPAAEERVRMSALFDAIETDYRNNARRSLATLGFRLIPLREAFGADRATDVTAARVARYAQDRLAAGKARATVNRELAALRRAFALAIEQERLSVAPRIKLMAEDNARQGFVTVTQFEAIAARLPDYLQDVARFSYLTGWRRGEVVSLEWADVDLEGERITLRRERSKNGQPRTIPFVGSLGEIIARRRAARGESQYVFHHNGRPIRDFRGAWDAACLAAKKLGLLFHDLRRSAVRNLVSAGVDQSVAMRITGHKTVFQRYRIVADDDVRAALVRTESAIKATTETRSEGESQT